MATGSQDSRPRFIPARTHGLAQKQSSIPIKRLQISNSTFTQIYHFEIQMLTRLVFGYTDVGYLQYQHSQPTHILGYTFHNVRDPNKLNLMVFCNHSYPAFRG
jgi:hypothetical protein